MENCNNEEKEKEIASKSTYSSITSSIYLVDKLLHGGNDQSN